MKSGDAKLPRRLRFWLLIFFLGAALGYFSQSSWPLKISNLFLRGLNRHGWDPGFRLYDRRGLNLNDQSGEDPVTMSTGTMSLLEELGESAFRYFMARDSDKDGFLNPVEFLGFYKLLSPIEIPQKSKPQSFEESSQSLQIETHFDPLLLNSTTKRLDQETFSNSDYFKGLLQWRQPHRRKTNVSVKDFVDLFWPQDARNLSVGQSYDVLFGKSASIEHLRSYPSASNRYFLPPFHSRSEAVMSHLLGAFHPLAFPRTRYKPSGSAGVVRASNKDFVEVAFRIHAEFQLNEPPNYPFWFTPSFFFGHAVVARDLSKVLAFRLSSPSERALNVDMEWLQANPNGNPMTTMVEVDIGYIPEMTLRLKPSASVQPGKWSKQISMKKAFIEAERHLYAFKKIEYVPFPDVLRRAQREDKLIHSVILWGSLDDQSC